LARSLGELIYAPNRASGEAISKVESHTPRIEAPDKVRAGEEFEVRVTVGPHPNTVQHSIRFIELYFEEEGRGFNPIHIATVRLEPEYAEPKLTFTLRLKKSGVLYAVEYCSLHGLWEARKEIRVA